MDKNNKAIIWSTFVGSVLCITGISIIYFSWIELPSIGSVVEVTVTPPYHSSPDESCVDKEYTFLDKIDDCEWTIILVGIFLLLPGLGVILKVFGLRKKMREYLLVSLVLIYFLFHLFLFLEPQPDHEVY